MEYFQNNNPNSGIFGGPYNGKNGNVLLPFGIYYGHLEYFMVISYLWGNLVILVYCVKKNLANPGFNYKATYVVLLILQLLPHSTGVMLDYLECVRK
jgi:hypothetical protein